MVGPVLYANDTTILLTDGTLFEAPADMRLPRFLSGASLLIEYEVIESRNVLTAVPQVRG